MSESGNVLPRRAADDSRDVALPYAESLRQSNLRCLTFRIHLPNHPNIIGGQLCAMALFATAQPFGESSRDIGVPVQAGTAPLHRAVPHVIGVGAQPKVIGVAARRIIAVGAVVQHMQSWGDRPVNECPHQAVDSPTTPHCPNHTVSIGQLGALPNPTPRAGVNVRLDEVGERCDRMGTHGEPPFRCAIPPAATNSAGDSLCPIIADWDRRNSGYEYS